MSVVENDPAAAMSAVEANRLRRATIGDMLRRQAARIGTKPAVIAHPRNGSRIELSYAELDIEVNRVANGLAALGVARGDRVAMMSRNSWQHIAAYFASLKLGAAYTTLNPTYRPREVSWQLDHAEPAVLFVEGATLDAALEGLDSASVSPELVLADGAANRPFISWSRLLDGVGTSEPEVEIHETDLAMLIYTSGTESTPKGVTVTHRNMLISTTPAWVMTRYVEETDVFLLLAPLYTMAGLGTVTTLLSIGATVVLTPTTAATTVLELMERESVTNISQTPTFYRRLVEHEGFADADLNSLRQCHVYGGQIPPEPVNMIRAAAPQAVWASYWGQSELGQLGSIGFFRELGDIPDGDLRWIGRPVPHLEVRIVDETGKDTDTGEMLCRSPSVMLGYYKDPEGTAEAFANGWLRTGDIVHRDQAGNLFFYDRSKDVIKTGGMNVSSAEVEGVLVLHPEVAAAAVVGVANPEWTEAVVAAVVPKDGQTIEPADVIEFCKAQLAGYKVPKSVIIMASLPRDPQGKILKRELRDEISGAI